MSLKKKKKWWVEYKNTVSYSRRSLRFFPLLHFSPSPYPLFVPAKQGIKTQTAHIPFLSETMQFFRTLGRCLIVSFFANFPAFIDQMHTLHRVFTVDIVHNKCKNFARLL